MISHVVSGTCMVSWGGGVVFKKYMYVMRCEWVIKLGEKFSLTNYVLILEETNAHRILVKYH